MFIFMDKLATTAGLTLNFVERGGKLKCIKLRVSPNTFKLLFCVAVPIVGEFARGFKSRCRSNPKYSKNSELITVRQVLPESIRATPATDPRLTMAYLQ